MSSRCKPKFRRLPACREPHQNCSLTEGRAATRKSTREPLQCLCSPAFVFLFSPRDDQLFIYGTKYQNKLEALAAASD